MAKETYLYKVIRNNRIYTKHCYNESQVKELAYKYMKKNNITMNDFGKDNFGYYCESKDIYIIVVKYIHVNEIKCECVKIEL